VNGNLNDNGAFRKKKVYFAQVSNEALRDPGLSLKAKGLYALIQSYITMENYILYKNKLKKDCSEGRDSFNSTWKELKDKGYLVQYKLKNEKGIFHYEYELLDESHVLNTRTMDNSDMGDAGNGKGGIYNNTNSNNTNSNNTKRKNREASLSPNDLDKFFNSIKADMIERNSEIGFYSFINVLDISQNENKIIIQCPNDFVKGMIENKFLVLIEIHLRKYFEFENIEIISGGDEE